MFFFKTRFGNSLIRFFFLSLLFLFLLPAHSQTKTISIQKKHLVTLDSLSSKNVLFRQFCEEVETNGKFLSRGDEPVLSFFKYTASADDDLLSLAARTSLPYETLATLNGLLSVNENLAGKLLILPTAAGLFLRETPDSAYEILLKKGRKLPETSPRYKIDGKVLIFLSGQRFTPTERSFFLDTTMKFPLDQKTLTSEYGYRVSPISGQWKFHSGIDLAADTGSNVYACKAGEVSSVGFNTTYGNYIILLHNGSMTSVYAHLSKIDVKTGERVYGGYKIGEVGTTGASTGPHLHFEVRIKGSPTDPGPLLSGK